MSEQKHSPEPWINYTSPRDDWYGMIYSPEAGNGNGTMVCQTPPLSTNSHALEDHHRILAMSAALAGIETAEIEAGVVDDMADVLRALQSLYAAHEDAYARQVLRGVKERSDQLLARLGRQS